MKNKRIITIITMLLLFCGMIAMVTGMSVMFSSAASGEKKEEGESDFLIQAKAYAEDAQYQKAMVLYQRANKINEGNLETLHALGEIYESLGYYEEKKAVYQSLTELESSLTDNWINLSNACIQLGELEEAKSIVEQRMQEDSSEELALLYAQMNVSTPKFNIQSGTYDTYQLLELDTAPENQGVYYTLDGSEPTKDSYKWKDGIVISAPETNVRARAVSYLGYESEVVDMNFTITAPIQNIVGDDYSNLCSYLRNEYFGRSWDAPIYNYEVAQIRSLYIVGSYYIDTQPMDITFYEDGYSRYSSRENQKGNNQIDLIQSMSFLKELAICCQDTVDLEQLNGLIYLENLSLLNDGITDIGALRNLTSLKKLSLGWNEIQDVSPLAELEQLTSLGLWNNQIQDISSLSGLTDLSYFDVTGNPAADTGAAIAKQ